jgi:branched-chain amino acid transport system ATP-binding protein
MTAMLEIENLWAAYETAEPVLKGVSLRLAANEVMAVLGANGAGKSTLLRVISGLLPCQRGHVRFDGVDVTRMAAHRRVEIGLVHVPEGRQVLPNMTIEENLLLGGYVRRRDKAAMEQSREQVYALFPMLKERRQQPAGFLSGGQQQMVALGRALMARPRLLLCDEPSFGLAPLVVNDIFRVLAGLRGHGTPILLVEQNAKKAMEVADRGLVLRGGAVAFTGSAAELAASEEVSSAYLGSAATKTAAEQSSPAGPLLSGDGRGA